MSELKAAALYINNSLVAQGYLREDEVLNLGQEEVGENIDEKQKKLKRLNDTRVINTIYGLLNTIEDLRMDRAKLEATSQTASRDVQRLVSEKRALESRYGNLERTLVRVEQSRGSLETNLKAVQKTNNELRNMNQRNKAAVEQIRSQFSNEIRKRDVEISQIRNRLMNPRSIKPSSNSIASIHGTLSGIYNSYGSSDNEGGLDESSRLRVSEKLIRMNNTLVCENSILLGILHSIKRSVSEAISQHNSFGQKFPEHELTTAKVSDDDAVVAVRTTDAESLGKEISDTVQQIISILNAPSYATLEEVDAKDKEIMELKRQIREVTDNWKEALNTMGKMEILVNDSGKGPNERKPLEMKENMSNA